MRLCAACSLLVVKAVSFSLKSITQEQEAPPSFTGDDRFDDMWEVAFPGLVETVSRGKTDPSSFEVSAWCNRSRYIRPSFEDGLEHRGTCSSTHVLQNYQYGKLVRLNGQLWFWVEIPKTGSTAVRGMIEDFVVPDSQDRARGYVSENDVAGINAFMFVRHPVTRFLSGYGTVIHRTCFAHGVTKEWDAICNMVEPERFSTFVRIFAERGSGIDGLLEGSGIQHRMRHIFSMTWFRNLWPGQISFLGQSDHYLDALADFSNRTGVTFAAVRKNTDEGGKVHINRTMLLQQQVAMQTLHEIFHDDMISFGYTALDLRALAGAPN